MFMPVCVYAQFRATGNMRMSLSYFFFFLGFPPEWADYKGLSLSHNFIDDGDRLYKWYSLLNLYGVTFLC